MSSYRNEKKVQLSSAVKEELKNGDKIEAIKMLREETGLNLKEAKELIETEFNNRTPHEDNIKNKINIPVPGSVFNYLRKGKKIDAITVLRRETGLGMKDAKDMVEKLLIENPDIKLKYDAETKWGVINFLLYAMVIIIIVLLVYNYFSR
ncbi:MAG: ribosomal protein L7/L12 [Ignavibacteriaceae bacterium]